MSSTRSTDKLWHVGAPATQELPSSVLPNREEVLCVLQYHAKLNPRDLAFSVRQTALNVQHQYSKANIPTIDPCDILKKVRRLHEEYNGLKKSKSRTTGQAEENRANFVACLKNLFDVAHRDAMSKNTIKEDRDFLEAQRKPGRQGKMGGMDRAWVEKETRTQQRRDDDGSRTAQESQAFAERQATVELESSTSCSSPEEQDVIASPPPKRSRRVPSQKKIISPQVSAALDRTNISDRKAAHVLLPFAEELGANTREWSLSASTINRQRKRHRQEKAAELKEKFAPDVPLTLHCDGKLMPSLTNEGVMDRLPILVSGEGVEKILAVPITDGKAEPTANTIHSVISEWAISDRIRALCFDTTATNTGSKGGVCVRLQQSLGRDLLHLACRHHMLEILLGTVFSALIPETSQSPDIAAFVRFREFWPYVEQDQYRTANEELKEDWVDDILKLCQGYLRKDHPRDDYRELLELAVVFLGGIPHGRKKIFFHKPGAVHRARWMARAIYALKMWIFAPQFAKYQKQRPSSSRAVKAAVPSKLDEFCNFIVRYYIRAWFSAACSANAPRNDLDLYKALVKKTNKAIRESGLKALGRHMWYLSEVTVGLALFDDEMPLEEKRNVVANLRSMEGSEEPPPKVCVEEADLDNKTVASFVTKNTEKFLDLLDIDKGFLDVDPLPCGGRTPPMYHPRGKASTWPSRHQRRRGMRGRSCAGFH
ncbi:hypothetical protein GWK47_000472 [Chionoecetes opilio]|uniref:Uncharacterized protein n=1 Tax=Chionoecetes opilio TaxID=41210 RepID=A0A8J4YJA6_CHIOP|nr:hypothetical protein GWK47_000472 [Chionoecetes opilio]